MLKECDFSLRTLLPPHNEKGKKKKKSSCSLELCLSLLWGIASPSNGLGFFFSLTTVGSPKTGKNEFFFSSHSALILIFFLSLSLSLSLLSVAF